MSVNEAYWNLSLRHFDYIVNIKINDISLKSNCTGKKWVNLAFRNFNKNKARWIDLRNEHLLTLSLSIASNSLKSEGIRESKAWAL